MCTQTLTLVVNRVSGPSLLRSALRAYTHLSPAKAVALHWLRRRYFNHFACNREHIRVGSTALTTLLLRLQSVLDWLSVCECSKAAPKTSFTDLCDSHRQVTSQCFSTHARTHSLAQDPRRLMHSSARCDCAGAQNLNARYSTRLNLDSILPKGSRTGKLVDFELVYVMFLLIVVRLFVLVSLYVCVANDK